MKQGFENDLTRCILPCYGVLSEQFIGRFLSGKIHFYHMNTRLYCQSFFIYIACAELVIRLKFVIFVASLYVDLAGQQSATTGIKIGLKCRSN